MIRKVAIVLAGIVFLFNSCYNDKEELLYGTTTCDGINATWSTGVNSIIQTYCNIPDCHAAGSTNGPGPLTNYTQARNAAISIKSAVVSRFMPQVGTLSTAQIKTISCWVDSGAPNN